MFHPSDKGSPSGFPLTRRAFVAGAASLVLVGCGSDDQAAASASAARGGVRTAFLDTVAWIEPSRRTAVLAFIPFRLTDAERAAVVKGQSVYPAISREEPMVELRLEIREGDARIEAASLRALQVTFWHFDNPAPVMRTEPADWSEEPDVSLVGLDGQLRIGGWAVGTIRGQKIISSISGDEAYTFNLAFQASLETPPVV